MEYNGKIRSATDIKDHMGFKQIGFTLVENPTKWFNIQDSEAILKELVKFVKKGNEVKFNIEPLTNLVKNFTVTKVAQEEKDWADDIVPYGELLEKAHEKGIEKIETQLLFFDFETKRAVCKAVLTGANGVKYEAHGDASSDSVKTALILPHFIRMAETRAKARAFRDYVNDTRCADVETTEGEI